MADRFTATDLSRDYNPSLLKQVFQRVQRALAGQLTDLTAALALKFDKAGGTITGAVTLPNTVAIVGGNAAATLTAPMLRRDANDNTAVGATNARDGYYAYANVGTEPGADLLAAAAGRNGCLVVDATNNRLVFYSGGNRYYITGTSF